MVKEHDVTMPLPDAVLRSRLIASSDADVVVADGDGSAGIRLEEPIGVAGLDNTDHLSLKPGYLAGKEAAALLFVPSER